MIYISISPDHQRTSSTDEIDDASAAQAPLLCCLATTRQPHVYYSIQLCNNKQQQNTHGTAVSGGNGPSSQRLHHYLLMRAPAGRPPGDDSQKGGLNKEPILHQSIINHWVNQYVYFIRLERQRWVIHQIKHTEKQSKHIGVLPREWSKLALKQQFFLQVNAGGCGWLFTLEATDAADVTASHCL
jgi:hypothetical protein